MTDMAYVGICSDCGGKAGVMVETMQREDLAAEVAACIEIGNEVVRWPVKWADMHRWCKCAADAYEIDMRMASEYPPGLDDGAGRVVREARG